RSVILARICPVAYKQNTNLSMQAFTAGEPAVFFACHPDKSGPLRNDAARGRLCEGLSPFINHPICD
ncbi:hypothetical protein, partial [Salmonella enterica]|uniref:hypothetical protein n=1 Tax=Salmonella enterica TaxID=28901 RepID=UPI00195819D5